MARTSSGRLRGLYAVTPPQASTAKLVADTALAVDGGARLVQYRAKEVAPALALEQANALAALCRARGVTFIVNDDIDLALASDADGVHLGRDDAPPAEARRRMPAGIIGLSCYADLARARAAASLDIDYVAVGSVFASPTKPLAARAPLELIGAARRVSGLPVAAIGGIDNDNAPLAVAAGADMLAVISAIYDAKDIAQAARRLAEACAAGEPHARA
jgi:thiamine-phosphate pyrophosphorylase